VKIWCLEQIPSSENQLILLSSHDVSGVSPSQSRAQLRSVASFPKHEVTLYIPKEAAMAAENYQKKELLSLMSSGANKRQSHSQTLLATRG